MPLAGKGMLLTSMDIDASDEAESIDGMDREHLLERVAIEGFLKPGATLRMRRLRKYLCPLLHRILRCAR